MLFSFFKYTFFLVGVLLEIEHRTLYHWATCPQSWIHYFSHCNNRYTPIYYMPILIQWRQAWGIYTFQVNLPLYAIQNKTFPFLSICIMWNFLQHGLDYKDCSYAVVFVVAILNLGCVYTHIQQHRHTFCASLSGHYQHML